MTGRCVTGPRLGSSLFGEQTCLITRPRRSGMLSSVSPVSTAVPRSADWTISFRVVLRVSWELQYRPIIGLGESVRRVDGYHGENLPPTKHGDRYASSSAPVLLFSGLPLHAIKGGYLRGTEQNIVQEGALAVGKVTSWDDCSYLPRLQNRDEYGLKRCSC